VLQERPEDIPTGELPRTLLMVVDRHLVGRVTPGSRLVVTGIYCTHRWGGGWIALTGMGWSAWCYLHGRGRCEEPPDAEPHTGTKGVSTTSSLH
jgi:hypothetical protein